MVSARCLHSKMARVRKCSCSIQIWIVQLAKTIKVQQKKFKCPSSASFSSFQTDITILTTNKCEKCPSSIQCWDSNPRPLGRESPPITTRPGLPSKFILSYESSVQILNEIINNTRILLNIIGTIYVWYHATSNFYATANFLMKIVLIMTPYYSCFIEMFLPVGELLLLASTVGLLFYIFKLGFRHFNFHYSV